MKRLSPDIPPDDMTFAIAGDGSLVNVDEMLVWDSESKSWVDNGAPLSYFAEGMAISLAEAKRIMESSKESTKELSTKKPQRKLSAQEFADQVAREMSEGLNKGAPGEREEEKEDDKKHTKY